MNSFLTWALVIALSATVLSLVLGLFNMFSVREGEGVRSNKLMRWRLAAQTLSLILFSFLLLMGKKS